MQLNIGLLLPNSNILPVAKDFEKGFKTALKNLDSAIEVEINKEFIGGGGTAATESALSKLVNYNNVDIVSGVLSARVTESIAATCKRKHKPLIVNNLGASLPDLSLLNEYVYINSYHLWQHAWALGYWGVKNLGKKGMFVGSVYDAGYSFPHMFHKGMMAANDESEWFFSVPPMPPKDELSDMSVIFPYLEAYQPDFIFAAFCGSEAPLFLNEFISRGWHKRTKVLGLPYLLAPRAPLADYITIYTTQIATPGNPVIAENSFYQLGYDSGNLLQKVLSEYRGTDIQQALQAQNGIVEFGGTNYIANESKPADTVTITANHVFAGPVEKSSTEVTTVDVLPVRDESFLNNKNEVNFGWMNPYLCV